MRTPDRLLAWCLVIGVVATACGGGSDSPAAEVAPIDPAAAAAADRRQATTATSSEEIDLFDATQIRGDPVNQYDLELGDCFNRIEALRAGRKVVITSRLDCEDSHQYEVFAVAQYDAPHPAIFPGDDAMTDFALDACYHQFENFVGEIYELSEHDIGVFIPNRDNFEHSRARYRGIHCWLHQGGDESVGSARSSGT